MAHELVSERGSLVSILSLAIGGAVLAIVCGVVGIGLIVWLAFGAGKTAGRSNETNG